jgi:hypothetical protein
LVPCKDFGNLFGPDIAEDVVIDDDDRAHGAHTQAAGSDQSPFSILAGFPGLELDLISQGLPDFSPADHMARGAFAKLDDVPAAFGGREHVVEAGNREKLAAGDLHQAPDFFQGEIGQISQLPVDVMQDWDQLRLSGPMLGDCSASRSHCRLLDIDVYVQNLVSYVAIK